MALSGLFSMWKEKKIAVLQCRFEGG